MAILLIQLLVVFSQDYVLASDPYMIKRLMKGERAPFSGSLVEDEGMRMIDVEMTEKRICETKLSDASSQCDAFSTPWPSNFAYFIMGSAVGILIFSSVSR